MEADSGFAALGLGCSKKGGSCCFALCPSAASRRIPTGTHVSSKSKHRVKVAASDHDGHFRRLPDREGESDQSSYVQYNIRSGRGGNWEIVLRAMEQMNVDLGVGE